jgi:hypothetical protein
MKLQILLLALLILALMTACGPQEMAQAGPAVWLDRPLNGSQHPLAPLTVQAHARPEPGGQILEVQLWVNGVLAQRMANPDPARPLVNLEQTWTPPANGEYLLQVRAVNAVDISSPPASARIRIGEAMPSPTGAEPPPADTPTATPTATPSVPAPASTDTPTLTLTPSATPTGTPPPTETPTPTATSTPTATPTSTATPTPTATSTPSPPPPPQINFRVDNENLVAGQCTTLRWDVDNVREVYIEGIGVPGHGSQDICPGESTTYTMRVVLLTGGEETRTVSVTVTQPADTQPPSINRATANPNVIWASSGCGPTQATFTALVTDDRGVAAVALWHRLGKGDWQTAPMSLTGTNTYQTNLNAPSQGGTLEWFIQAQDTAGNTAKSGIGGITVNYCIR